MDEGRWMPCDDQVVLMELLEVLRVVNCEIENERLILEEGLTTTRTEDSEGVVGTHETTKSDTILQSAKVWQMTLNRVIETLGCRNKVDDDHQLLITPRGKSINSSMDNNRRHGQQPQDMTPISQRQYDMIEKADIDRQLGTTTSVINDDDDGDDDDTSGNDVNQFIKLLRVEGGGGGGFNKMLPSLKELGL
jgi:hypothetical protein